MIARRRQHHGIDKPTAGSAFPGSNQEHKDEEGKQPRRTAFNGEEKAGPETKPRVSFIRNAPTAAP